MPNQDHVDLLLAGVRDPWDWRRHGDPDQQPRNAWNEWREANPGVLPDLRGSDFSGQHCHYLDLSRANFQGASLRQTDFRGADLSGANLSEADLEGACLRDATLIGANLKNARLGTGPEGILTDLSGARLWDAVLEGTDFSGAFLVGAKFRGANLRGAKLSGADLSDTDLREVQIQGANLSGAQLSGADCTQADFTEANLTGSVAIETDFTGANLTGCRIYGISAWDVVLTDASQSNLVITRNEPHVRVDDLEVAQFIYLLLNRSKLRNVLTTLGEKAVLVLGRFAERKDLLDGIADKLRSLGYLPILFDFERPVDRDLTETVRILAGLSRFVIADITNPMSVPMELQAVVPDYEVPFVTVLQRGYPAFGMFDDLPRKYDWALPLLEYNNRDSLLAAFESKIVGPALEKLAEVRRRKALPSIRRSAEE